MNWKDNVLPLSLLFLKVEKPERWLKILRQQSIWGFHAEAEASRFIGQITGLPWWLSWLRICLQCRRPGSNPWVGKIPWRGEQLPTPVFWPGEFHGLYSPWGCKESDMTAWDYFSHFYEDEKKKPSEAWKSNMLLRLSQCHSLNQTFSRHLVTLTSKSRLLFRVWKTAIRSHWRKIYMLELSSKRGQR